MAFKAIILLYLTFFTANILGRDLEQSSWIWTNDQADASTARAFQRVYVLEDGKVPVSAKIVVASGQKHDLYVNDNHIEGEDDVEGKSGDGSVARVRTAFLKPGQNIFRIKTHGRHGPIALPPTGVLSSIVMTFNDGSEREIPSDSEWVATTLPYEEGEHKWGRVKVLGAYGEEPWGKIIVLPESLPGYYGGDYHHHHKHHHTTPPAGCTSLISPPSHQDASFLKSLCADRANHLPPLTTPPLSYATDAKWIWTSETDAHFNAPVGTRAFRKVVCLDKGTTINALNMTIEVDDNYSLFLQGTLIPNVTDPNWASTFHHLINFCTPVSGPDAIVIAMNATNVGGLANIITSIDFLGSGPNGTGLQGVVVSDHTWKFNFTVPEGFDERGYDDSTWRNASEYGTYSHGPYAVLGSSLSNNSTLNVVNV